MKKKLKENQDFVTFIQRRKNASNFGTEEAKTYIPYDMQKNLYKKRTYFTRRNLL